MGLFGRIFGHAKDRQNDGWQAVVDAARASGAPPIPWRVEQVDAECAKHIAAFLWGGRVEEARSPTGPRLEVFQAQTPRGGEPIAVFARVWDADECRLMTTLTYAGEPDALAAQAIEVAGFELATELGDLRMYSRR